MPRDYTAKKPLPQSKYGRLLIIENAKGGWLCRCDCGVEKIVKSQALKNGATKSCGCLNAERIRQPRKHGMTHEPIYRLWVSMIDRCYRESMVNYPSYGGRGIAVCDRWHDFNNFFADMGHRPKGRTLDRIDPNGNYEPENCRWATNIEQSNNRRNNVILSHAGKTQSVSQWARELGINDLTIRARLNRGCSIEAALQPVNKSRRPEIPIQTATRKRIQITTEPPNNLTMFKMRECNYDGEVCHVHCAAEAEDEALFDRDLGDD